MLSVHWPDNFDWVELSWDMLGWYAPINGTLICQNATGLSTPAYAFRWAGIASTFCITKWKRPDNVIVNITVGIAPGESVLSVAGPLQCGVTQGQVPPLPNDDNDDKNPWYLDYFGVPPTLGQYPAIAQHPQFGTSQPMFPQSTEIPSFYNWRFDESGAQGMILWPGTPQNQQSNIKLAAIGNTDSGAIKPRCEFTGTFRGHSYSYDDEQDYRILQSDWTWAVRPHLLTFTGHQPGTVEIVGDPLIDSNATTGNPPEANPNRTHCWFYYQMRLFDLVGRPMHGAWVQEKFYTTPEDEWTSSLQFRTNAENEIWTTLKNQAQLGFFNAYDKCGYGGVNAPEGVLLFRKFHRYFAGTSTISWTPTAAQGGGWPTSRYRIDVWWDRVAHVLLP